MVEPRGIGWLGAGQPERDAHSSTEWAECQCQRQGVSGAVGSKSDDDRWSVGEDQSTKSE